MENSYSPESSGASSTKNQGSWYAILAVAIGAFALVTSEFLPVGVLNSVAADLNIWWCFKKYAGVKQIRY